MYKFILDYKCSSDDNTIMSDLNLQNPYRPGAGHPPPFLAGRDKEITEFSLLLDQQVIIKNCILTGLRGVGKTVLLNELKKTAINKNWLWTSNEISESSSATEEKICYRLIADLAMVTSGILLSDSEKELITFFPENSKVRSALDYKALELIYQNAPGLNSDKLKFIFEFVWSIIRSHMPHIHGIVIAYDESQSLSDNVKLDRYPLTLLLDVFQSIQRKEIPFMLLLSGLPTIQTKLVESRTYSERMFTVLFLKKLSTEDSILAITKPVNEQSFPIQFDDRSVNLVVKKSGGYPYFIQFICKEIFDIFIQQHAAGQKLSVPIEAILRKLDDDFFSGRWGLLTDRQRELLAVVSHLSSCEEEFSVQEVVNESKKYEISAFGNSQINQMFLTLITQGFIFKNRFGKYSFAVPQLGEFILRQKIIKEKQA